jgi:hypothetical protein
MSEILPLRSVYEFIAKLGIEDEIQDIREMDIDWKFSQRSSVRRGYIVSFLESKDLFQQFKDQYWQFGNTAAGQKKRDWYLRLKSDYEMHKKASGTEETEDEDEEPGSSFVFERELRNYLEKNLSRIEAGLRLFERDGKRGVEYHVDNGYIDLLAEDRNGHLVVIELKVSRGPNKTLGQILYYMAWVDAHLAKGKKCRGIIIANEIPNSLRLAAKRADGITLHKYNLSVTVEQIPVGA